MSRDGARQAQGRQSYVGRESWHNRERSGLRAKYPDEFRRGKKQEKDTPRPG